MCLFSFTQHLIHVDELQLLGHIMVLSVWLYVVSYSCFQCFLSTTFSPRLTAWSTLTLSSPTPHRSEVSPYNWRMGLQHSYTTRPKVCLVCTMLGVNWVMFSQSMRTLLITVQPTVYIYMNCHILCLIMIGINLWLLCKNCA